jgi:hypothetical protein
MIRILVVTTAIFLFSCSGSNNSNSTPNVDWTKGRGDAACHEWQQAYCELGAKCAGAALSDCAQQYQGIVCNSDTTAANCATTLGAANCSSLPTGCNATDVADATTAVAGCNQLYTAICTHNATCGSTTAVDACVSQLQSQNNCNNAIGLELGFETCLSKVNAAACTATQQPSECKNVIVNAS